MKKRRSLAALLCLCLLAGSLPARALDLGGLALPAYRTEELEQAVPKNTARAVYDFFRAGEKPGAEP